MQLHAHLQLHFYKFRVTIETGINSKVLYLFNVLHFKLLSPSNEILSLCLSLFTLKQVHVLVSFSKVNKKSNTSNIFFQFPTLYWPQHNHTSTIYKCDITAVAYLYTQTFKKIMSTTFSYNLSKRLHNFRGKHSNYHNSIYKLCCSKL